MHNPASQAIPGSRTGRPPRDKEFVARTLEGPFHEHLMEGSTEIPEALVARLNAARNICVLTGAGISAESGIPTFRDALTGLWEKYDPEELATPEAFQRQPKLVWDWYAWRRKLIHGVEPNPGHEAIANMEKHVPHFTLVTQNVDGLHQRAGSRSPIELHGNILRTKCSREDRVVEQWKESGESPPRCPHCGGMLRPDVVWFGEMLPQDALQQAIDAVSSCDVLFSVGTSGIVYPAAGLPAMGKENGAVTIEVNPDETPLSSIMDYTLRGPAGEVLPRILHQAWG